MENMVCAVSANPPLLSGPQEPLPFISYAQNFEDVMLWRALGHIQIDIGVGKPEDDSITKAFYDRGWSGINVEPAAGPFARLAAARPHDRNLRLLVGDSEGAWDFFLIGEENTLSTVVPELGARHSAAGWACRKTAMQITTLARICDQHVRGQIHFPKIDAEWSELAIMRGADFARFRPWIVLFGAIPIDTGPHSFKDCDRVLEQAGYRFLYADGLNRFWAAEERYADLAPRFSVPPNVFDGFVRATEVDARARIGAALDDARCLHEQACHEAAAARDELGQAA
jgi:FkbM family methyltransferase